MDNKFFIQEREYRSLSNFLENDVVINNTRVYESGEHCFYGENYARMKIENKFCWIMVELL